MREARATHISIRSSDAVCVSLSVAPIYILYINHPRAWSIGAATLSLSPNDFLPISPPYIYIYVRESVINILMSIFAADDRHQPSDIIK